MTVRIIAVVRAFVAAATLLCLFALPAAAQATRTWVSGVGDDANPCSRTAPCKTFAGAISKTAAGGEISIIDRGAYGAVTITKAMSITADTSFASILDTSTNGVTINAGPNDVVALRGLSIIGGATGGLAGVRVLAAKAVHITDCSIRTQTGTPGAGIDILPAAPVSVFISNCDISSNTIGIQVKPTGNGKAIVFVDRVTLDRNATAGLLVSGNQATVRLSNSVISRNAPGLSVASGGQIISFGNNAIGGNVPDGAPTSTIRLK